MNITSSISCFFTFLQPFFLCKLEVLVSKLLETFSWTKITTDCFAALNNHFWTFSYVEMLISHMNFVNIMCSINYHFLTKYYFDKISFIDCFIIFGNMSLLKRTLVDIAHSKVHLHLVSLIFFLNVLAAVE